MNKKILLVTLSVVFNFSLSYAKNCSLTDFITKPSIENKQLSYYWAQILIGSDLAHEELKKIQTRKVNFGIYDEFFNSSALNRSYPNITIDKTEGYVEEEHDAHGNHVINLISGVPQISSSKNGNLVFAGTVGFYPYWENSNRFGSSIPLPEVINISHDIKPFSNENDHAKYPLLKKFLAKSTYVCAAGNNYPSYVDSPDGDCDYVVGSIDHTGLISFYSAEGNGVNLLAPSGTNIGSHDGLNYLLFGGTSGAAPLVTGTAIDILSTLKQSELLEKDLNEILTQSLISLPQLKDGQNGKGLLNQLKAIYLAKAAVARKKINLNIIASEYLQKANSTSCLNDKFNYYRYAFLLGSNKVQKNAAKEIALIFKNINLSESAIFYDNFSSAFEKYKNFTLIDLYNEDDPSVIRASFDFNAISVEDALINFEKFKPIAKGYILSEIVHNIQYKEFIKKQLSSEERIEDYDMTVGEWAEYLLKRF